MTTSANWVPMCALTASTSSSGASEADPASWAWAPKLADANPANAHQDATATRVQAVVVFVWLPAGRSRPRSIALLSVDVGHGCQPSSPDCAKSETGYCPRLPGRTRGRRPWRCRSSTHPCSLGFHPGRGCPAHRGGLARDYPRTARARRHLGVPSTGGGGAYYAFRSGEAAGGRAPGDVKRGAESRIATPYRQRVSLAR